MLFTQSLLLLLYPAAFKRRTYWCVGVFFRSDWNALAGFMGVKGS